MAFFNGVRDPETLLLTASLLLILFFSVVMKETGTMARSISALQEIFRDARATVAMIPAVIGILPIMGGAMLSAPLALEASDELKLFPGERTFNNFWFRHVWEYTLPTHPGIILIATIVGIPVAEVSFLNLPLTIAAIAVGILFAFRGVTSSSSSLSPLTCRLVCGNIVWFVMNLLPFFVVLLLTLYFKIHLAYSLAFAVAGTILYYHPPRKWIWQLAKISFSWEIIFLIWGIMIFKEVLMVSRAMNSVAKEFIELGLPPLFLILTLAVILGLITGYSNAYIGLRFPTFYCPFSRPALPTFLM